jgi:hypothetical protein
VKWTGSLDIRAQLIKYHLWSPLHHKTTRMQYKPLSPRASLNTRQPYSKQLSPFKWRCASDSISYPHPLSTPPEQFPILAIHPHRHRSLTQLRTSIGGIGMISSEYSNPAKSSSSDAQSTASSAGAPKILSNRLVGHLQFTSLWTSKVEWVGVKNVILV